MRTIWNGFLVSGVLVEGYSASRYEPGQGDSFEDGRIVRVFDREVAAQLLSEHGFDAEVTSVLEGTETTSDLGMLSRYFQDELNEALLDKLRRSAP